MFEREIQSYRDEVEKLIATFLPDAESTTRLDMTASQLSLLDVRSSLILATESQARTLRSGSSQGRRDPAPQLSGELLTISRDPSSKDTSSPRRPASTPPRITTPIDREVAYNSDDDGVPTRISLPHIPLPSLAGEILPGKITMIKVSQTAAEPSQLTATTLRQDRRLSAPVVQAFPPQGAVSSSGLASLPSQFSTPPYSEQTTTDAQTGQDLPASQNSRAQQQASASEFVVPGHSVLPRRQSVDPQSGQVVAGIPQDRRKSEQVTIHPQLREALGLTESPQVVGHPQDRRKSSASEHVIIPLQDPDLSQVLVVNSRPASQSGGQRRPQSAGSSQARSYNQELDIASNIVSSTSNMPDESRSTYGATGKDEWTKKEAKYKKKLHASIVSNAKVKMELLEKEKELKFAQHEIEVLERRLREMEHLAIETEMKRRSMRTMESSAERVEALSDSIATPISKTYIPGLYTLAIL